MNLAQFPRRQYLQVATPIEYLPNFSKALGGPDIYMKRDDLLPGPGGGNKTRKLEFCIAEALEQGADTIITCGAVQSNHCRLTLGWAVKEGLKCRLVLEERVPGSYDPKASGNNFLFHLMGVDSIRVVPGGSDMMGAMEQEAEACRSEGGKPYIIPGGASNPIGATGYVACAQEMAQQLYETGLVLDHIIVPSGSAGTHAGMVVGMVGCHMNIPISGINVSRTKEDQEAIVYDLAQRTAERVGCPGAVTREAVTCYGDYVGPGYSRPTQGMVDAVNMLAKTEAILLDPVYSGKAMDGLVDQVRTGRFKQGEHVLFLHTGGSPALYAYLDTFQQSWANGE
jgi:D-cysteine desulfhydrase